VTARLKAVADECNSSTSGVTSYHCRDTYRGCTNSNVLAYTVPSQNYIVNCPLYFNALQPLAKRCHQQDQATTTLHEMTHAPKVFIPGTDDKGYGYAAASKLDSTQALNNADTYALFTNGERPFFPTLPFVCEKGVWLTDGLFWLHSYLP